MTIDELLVLRLHEVTKACRFGAVQPEETALNQNLVHDGPRYHVIRRQIVLLARCHRID
jgi:hypothetical protein